MENNYSKQICDVINDAISKREEKADKDVTYICSVMEINENHMYKLRYNNADYDISLNNITPKLGDKLHLVIPQGDFKNKYILEDIISSVGGADPRYDGLDERVTALEEELDGVSDIVNNIISII